eukprot:TRINITY_DN7122_c0_g1_i1.p1 TRINITY_DN7122_c0_g1~~TRINITY_DN7122_c0_g1_i1.p1  ORF type:complete len:319 (-),score=54.71 TRINITY_DN7122_c0_g1_i1:270-1205(-)
MKRTQQLKTVVISAATSLLVVVAVFVCCAPVSASVGSTLDPSLIDVVCDDDNNCHKGPQPIVASTPIPKPLPLAGGCPSRRVAVDNFLTQSECQEIMKFAAKYLKKAEVGDELSGTDIHTIIGDYAVNETAMNLFLNIRERMLDFIVGHFSQPHPEDGGEVLAGFKDKKPLCFDFTHITSRQAGLDSYSHGIHADNCVLSGNRKECSTMESFCCEWRDVSALLYLNDQGEEFTGGDLIFAPSSGCNEEEITIPPMCGRMVAFTSGMENPHGVGQVLTGTRWAIASWYTFDCENHDEQSVLDIWFWMHPRKG